MKIYHAENFPAGALEKTSKQNPQLVHFTVAYKDDDNDCQVGLDAYVWEVGQDQGEVSLAGFTQPDVDVSGIQIVFPLMVSFEMDQVRNGFALAEITTQMEIRPAGIKVLV